MIHNLRRGSGTVEPVGALHHSVPEAATRTARAEFDIAEHVGTQHGSLPEAATRSAQTRHCVLEHDHTVVAVHSETVIHSVQSALHAQGPSASTGPSTRDGFLPRYERVR